MSQGHAVASDPRRPHRRFRPRGLRPGRRQAGPSLDLSAPSAVATQLNALQDNNTPRTNHGLEARSMSALCPPYARSLPAPCPPWAWRRALCPLYVRTVPTSRPLPVRHGPGSASRPACARPARCRTLHPLSFPPPLLLYPLPPSPYSLPLPPTPPHSP